MKVLVVNTCGLATGGITTNMLNYLGQIINSEIKVDIVATILVDEDNILKFEKMGCRVIRLPNRKTELFYYLKALGHIIKDRKYDVIHVHGNSATMMLELGLAKKMKISKRIAHCHNTKCNHPIINKILTPYFRSTYTVALACSNLAGEWIFEKNQYSVLHNAIDLDKFEFNPEIRKQYREKMGIEESTIVVGHVGNINEQKNHDFLLKVFALLSKKRKVELLLIGEGPLRKSMEDKVLKQGMQKCVHFLGVCEDVASWMQAMDIFLFPSKWEGLGIVAIEAQAAGLIVITSTEVPEDAHLTDKFHQKSLKEPIDSWCNLVEKLAELPNDRFVQQEKLLSYDISYESRKLLEIYES